MLSDKVRRRSVRVSDLFESIACPGCVRRSPARTGRTQEAETASEFRSLWLVLTGAFDPTATTGRDHRNLDAPMG